MRHQFLSNRILVYGTKINILLTPDNSLLNAFSILSGEQAYIVLEKFEQIA